jgi:hypothetical protein
MTGPQYVCFHWFYLNSLSSLWQKVPKLVPFKTQMELKLGARHWVYRNNLYKHKSLSLWNWHRARSKNASINKKSTWRVRGNSLWRKLVLGLGEEFQAEGSTCKGPGVEIDAAFPGTPRRPRQREQDQDREWAKPTSLSYTGHSETGARGGDVSSFLSLQITGFMQGMPWLEGR